MKDLLERWLHLKDQERSLKEQREEIEIELFNSVRSEMDDSQRSWMHDNFKLTIKPNYSVKVDQEKAAENPAFFKIKYELSYSQFKKSNKIIEDFVVITPIKPTFSVEIK